MLAVAHYRKAIRESIPEFSKQPGDDKQEYAHDQKIWKIPVRIILDSVSALKNIFLGEPAYFVAVAMAHMAYVNGYW
jgi:hypothetical protein